MSKYKPVLDAAVPHPDAPADVPKALGAMAGAIDQALDEQRDDLTQVMERQRADVDRLARDLDGAGIRDEVKKHHVLWGIMVQGGTL